VESTSCSSSLFEHDLRANAFRVCREGKPVSTFPDHALASMRGSRAMLGKHALGDGDDVGWRDVAHAAMVVHPADRAVARLTGDMGRGLDGGGKPVERRPMVGAGRTENAHGRRAQ